MIVSESTIVKWGSSNKKDLIDKGYSFTKLGDTVEVKIMDMPKKSKSIVDVKCDICKDKTYKTSIYNAFKCKSHKCKDCKKAPLLKVKCGNCNKEIEVEKSRINKSVSGDVYCSNACVGEANRGFRNRVIKRCLTCDKEYEVIKAREKTSVTCSVKCQSKWQSNYLIAEKANRFVDTERIKHCCECGCEYKVSSPYKYKSQKFCSYECKNKNWVRNTLNSRLFKEKRYEGIMSFRSKISKTKYETMPEKLFREYLEENNILYEQEKGLMGKYFCDFYLPKYHLIIEVMGDYWHGNTKVYNQEDLSISQLKQKKKDELKKNDLISSGFNYMEIWESEINDSKIEEILKKNIYHIKLSP